MAGANASGLGKSSVTITCQPERLVCTLSKHKANQKEPKYCPGKGEGTLTPGKYRGSQRKSTSLRENRYQDGETVILGIKWAKKKY